ncbi:MAG: T9SS type A sorting domain-containing protein [Gammaproteobacteria bacterium]|nr:T9SS type A sorting domain-containing protein [Gammaproteobacteria bacterium]
MTKLISDKLYVFLTWSMLVFLVATCVTGYTQVVNKTSQKAENEETNKDSSRDYLSTERKFIPAKSNSDQIRQSDKEQQVGVSEKLFKAVPTGSETLVNSSTTNTQQNPAVAMDSTGNFVVVWESDGTDGDGYGIYGQRYNSDGTTSGSEFNVNSSTAGNQRFPDVAMDQTGRFAVVWMDDTKDGSGWGVYGRRYNSNGTTYGSEFRVKSGKTGHQRNPQLAMDEDGDFFITWMDVAIDGSSFAIEGKPYAFIGAVASDFQINTSAASYHGYPSIAKDINGNFVIAWQSLGLDGSGHGIYAQRYNSSWSAQDSEFKVNTTTSGNQQEPGVAIDSSGNFVISWTSFGQDGGNGGIYAQRYTSDGSDNGSEFKVNTTTAGSQDNASITSTTEGIFTVAWNSYSQDGSYDGVYLQVFNSEGDTSGVETLVNTRTSDFQQFPAIAQYRYSDTLVAAWQDGLRNSTSTNDGNDYGIYIQRSSVAVTIEMIVSNSATWIDEYGATLENGDIIQILWTGADGQIDSPVQNIGNANNGQPTDDDEIIMTTAIGVGTGTAGQFSITIDSYPNRISGTPISGDNIYVRAFNDNDLVNATYYDDAQLYSVTYIDEENYVPALSGNNTDLSLPVELSVFNAEPAFSKVVFSWETASELENLGFNLFIKKQDEEEWFVLNEEIIPGKGNTSSGSKYQFVHDDVKAGETYSYRLESVSYNGEIEFLKTVDIEIPVPKQFALFNNYPNPFNPVTHIKFQLPRQSSVTLVVYDMTGRIVKKLLSKQNYDAGEYVVRWDGTNPFGNKVASGMYFFRIFADNPSTSSGQGFVKTQKMILMK